MLGNLVRSLSSGMCTCFTLKYVHWAFRGLPARILDLSLLFHIPPSRVLPIQQVGCLREIDQSSAYFKNSLARRCLSNLIGSFHCAISQKIAEILYNIMCVKLLSILLTVIISLPEG